MRSGAVLCTQLHTGCLKIYGVPLTLEATIGAGEAAKINGQRAPSLARVRTQMYRQEIGKQLYNIVGEPGHSEPI